MMRRFNATTACIPGKSHLEAVRGLADGVSEPLLGVLGIQHIQLCPQHPTAITECLIDELLSEFPRTAFRLHASVRLASRFEMSKEGRRHIPDAANVPGHWGWFTEAARLSGLLGANAYTLHAGRRKDASLLELADNVKALVQLFGHRVGVEGLYPAKDEWLIQDWSEYAWLLNARIDFAIDFSHLKIVAHKTGHFEHTLVRELVASEHCIEVHVSDNDGRHDRHEQLVKEPLWWGILPGIHELAVCFSEGTQKRTAD